MSGRRATSCSNLLSVSPSTAARSRTETGALLWLRPITRTLIRPPRWRSESAFADALYSPAPRPPLRPPESAIADALYPPAPRPPRRHPESAIADALYSPARSQARSLLHRLRFRCCLIGRLSEPLGAAPL